MKQYKFKINGTEYAVDIIDVDGDMATVAVNGSNFEVEVEGMTVKPASKTPKVVKPAMVSAPATAPKAAPAAAPAGTNAVKAPLPGVVLSIDVKVGETVKVGQRLFVLEAMKMENNIDSDREGIVREIKIDKGDSVLEGDVIMTIG